MRNLRPQILWRKAFTLVELLVVIAIIGALLGVTLPAVQSARAAAWRLECSNKMRQIGLAIRHYHETYGQYPPSKWGIESSTDPYNRSKHNVLTFLLPFLEQQAVHDAFDFRFDWDHADNQFAREHHLALFRCPASPGQKMYGNKEYFLSDYAACEKIIRGGTIKALFESGIVSERPDYRGLNGILQPSDVAYAGVLSPYIVTDALVTDGLSNTMLFFECAARPHHYTIGRRPKNVPASASALTGADWASNLSAFQIHDSCGAGGRQLFNCNNENEVYSFHAGGANFVFGDDSVHFLSETIHPEAFISLFTAFAGDQASLD